MQQHGFSPIRAVFLLSALILSVPGATLKSQTVLQARVWLSDKGVPNGLLSPGDPSYDAAVEHLSERALRRRSRVLAPDRMVSTRDLPISGEYQADVEQLGAMILQSSRWFNTLLIISDTSLYSKIEALPFVDSVSRLGVAVTGRPAFRMKELSLEGRSLSPPIADDPSGGCLTQSYGLAESQLQRIGADHAHRIGISGSDVFIGILDAGFDWRNHPSLSNLAVIAERDFVNNDTVTSDEIGQTPSREHGSLVMSVIGGLDRGRLIGVAPDAHFALAKTEDVATETPVEEDNFVAGLEWLESLGVDITNTSLGYTTFDSPYFPHGDGDLDGNTAFASRGVNYAATLGVLNITSAGNEYTTFRRVGVPGEADSAIAVAALDSADNKAPFSSSGSGNQSRLKPDIAAPGVAIFSADFNDERDYRPVQGTSLAAPLVTGAAALILSSDTSLTSSELRAILLGSATRSGEPDSLVGAGRVNIDAGLLLLARERGFAARPLMRIAEGNINLTQWIVSGTTDAVDQIEITSARTTIDATLINNRSGERITASTSGPRSGLVRWFIKDGVEDLAIEPGDSITVLTSDMKGASYRPYQMAVSPIGIFGGSRLCITPTSPTVDYITSRPNPMIEAARVEFQLIEDAPVQLELFNAAGERVLKILEGSELTSGFHSYLVLPNDLPSGAYYYRLMVGDELYSWPTVRLR